MLNIEMQSGVVPFFNSTQQIKNIGDMIQNIALQMNNMNTMKMNNFNNAVPLPNMMPNNNYQTNSLNIIKVTFQTVENEKTTLSFNHNTTIEKMIEKYYEEKRLNKSPKDDKSLIFIYNAQRIYPDNKTTLENYFENNKNPIVVIAHNDIIG